MRYIRLLHVVVFVSAFLGASLLGATPCRADDSRITVKFYEGHFEKGPTDEASKYSALVSVWRCTPGFQELGQFRGSTLPNPYWVYKDAIGKPFDIDGRLHDVFQHLDALDLESVGLGGIRPLVQIFREDKKYPIVQSGRFDFTVVEHPKYIPRALRIAGGGFVPTLNPNPHQGNAFKANGILVHRGRRTGKNRDSEGCLTIDPDDWNTFIQLLPAVGYTGVVEVVRPSSYLPAPRCLRSVP